MKVLSVILWIMCVLMIATVIVPPVVRQIDRRVTCTGYLDRAANANTAKLACEQLDRAIVEIEHRGWTNGSTRVFFNYPQCDLGYWYQNLVAARAELRALPEMVSALEQSNLLMKLRETLTEQGEHGSKLIVPPMLNFYPSQMFWFLWWFIGSALAVLLGIYARIVWEI